MSDFEQLLTFRLGEHRFALQLSAVERIVRAAEITPMPRAPAIVLGVLDLRGQLVPVLDMRSRFGLPRQDIEPKHQFLIAYLPRRTVAVVIDEALEVIDIPSAEIVEAAEVVPGVQHIRGVATVEDGLVLIHDLAQFLSLDETAALETAMMEDAFDGA